MRKPTSKEKPCIRTQRDLPKNRCGFPDFAYRNEKGTNTTSPGSCRGHEASYIIEKEKAAAAFDGRAGYKMLRPLWDKEPILSQHAYAGQYKKRYGIRGGRRKRHQGASITAEPGTRLISSSIAASRFSFAWKRHAVRYARTFRMI